MSWFGSDAHFALLMVAIIAEVGVIGYRYIDKPRRVSHRRLRAAIARGEPATGTAPHNAPVAGDLTSQLRAVGHLHQGDVPSTARRGSVAAPATSSPTRAQTTGNPPLGAGPTSGLSTVDRHQARTRARAADGCPESRATADTQGAHGVSDPGSATQTATTSLVAGSRGGLGLKQPVDVGAPRPDIDRCRTHPRGEGDDATCPRLVASSRRPS